MKPKSIENPVKTRWNTYGRGAEMQAALNTYIDNHIDSCTDLAARRAGRRNAKELEASQWVKKNGVLGVEIHRMATSIVKRHTRQSVEQRSPVLSFPFMDLPVEIQVMILEYTDLVAPSPVTASTMKGYILDDCRAGRCAQMSCEGHYMLEPAGRHVSC